MKEKKPSTLNSCKKCGYMWAAKKKNPVSCPKCKSYTWDSERK
jgi:predicted Zn-ribbon and HTH transcriptional regulator